MTSAGITLALAVVAIPVITATAVLAYHVVRGTDPGPAAPQLITLVRLVLRRPPRA